ncbi:MAG TPA: GNAT family N-acetyltransferase [Anaerolineales bacterium]|nr:GNAT family N-acetyltransferase [Anaerolineales bacterium]
MGTKPQTRKRPAGPARRPASNSKSPKPPTAPASDLAVRPLDESTWPDFARLVEKHNGVWGGCWCMGFHLPAKEPVPHEPHRAQKERRVRAGQAHAALVYDGEAAVGWCQFGPTDELPGIKLRKAYQEGLTRLPDWRITCFFVDKDHRHRGVAVRALEGALDQIASLGGGLVESYPEQVEGRTTSGSFLYNATLSMFERLGFKRVRKLGMTHWVVTKVVRGK